VCNVRETEKEEKNDAAHSDNKASRPLISCITQFGPVTAHLMKECPSKKARGTFVFVWGLFTAHYRKGKRLKKKRS